MELRRIVSPAVLLLALTMGQLLYAQVQGALVGTVRDTTGAVVPNASIVATNRATAIEYKTLSNGSGDFTFSILPIGTYDLTFSAKSFQELKVEGIGIHVASTIRQDATLPLATVTTKVQVIASAPLVKSETAEIGNLVRGEQVTELPLNGRSVYTLVALTAGSETGLSGSARFTSANRPTIAGGRAGNTRFQVNGVDVTTQGTPSAGVTPLLDSVEEFRVVSTLAPAADSSTSSVQLVTKSGTNQFHGTVYEFLRNNVLDGHPFFLRQLPPPVPAFRPQQRLNQFGGTLGGPIKKNRSFFFGAFEIKKQILTNQYTNLFPTAAMIQGDLSGLNPLTRKNFGPVFDPQTGKTFPGNMVPVSSFAQKFLQAAVPAANCLACLSAGLGIDFLGAARQPINFERYQGRGDYHLSDRDTLFANFQRQPTFQVTSASPIPAENLFTRGAASVAVVNWNHIFSPALLSQARLGWTRLESGIFQGADAKGAFPFLNAPFSSPANFPAVQLIGYRGMFGNQALSQQIQIIEESWNLVDDWTYVRGGHEIKFGFNGSRDHEYVKSSFNGFLIFADGLPPIFGFSTSGFADFLLGLPFVAVGTQGIGRANLVERSRFAFYLQDNWKIKPRLTMNIGMRWEYAQRWHDGDKRLNRLATLDTSAASRAVGGQFLIAGSSDVFIPGKGIVPGGGGRARPSLLANRWRDFQPRIGLAYRPFNNNKTAIRAGYGVYFTIPDAVSVTVEETSPPFQAFNILVNIPASLTVDKLFPAANPKAGAGLVGQDINNSDPYTQQWTMSFQQQVGDNLLLAAEYLGNYGQRLPFTDSPQEPPLPNAAQLAVLLANPSLSTPLAVARSPFPNIGNSFQFFTNVGQSWYHALNLKADGHFGKRLNLSAAYTYSKSLDNASAEQQIPLTTFNRRLSKSLSDFDHRHRFVASWVYTLPFGEHYQSVVLKKLVSGWESSGVATFEAGPPFSVLAGVDSSFRATGTDFPNLNGPPVFSDIRATNGIFLTPKNFAIAPFGTLGSFPRNGLRGPSFNNFDLGLIKNTSMGEKLNIQFRAEMFNAFNHANFFIANQTLANAINPPPPGSTMPVVAFRNPSLFGRAGARSPRNVQFALKLIF